MRQCWNRQTGTFEGRVSKTYGFKSHLPHHQKDQDFCLGLFDFVTIRRRTENAKAFSYFAL